MGGGGDGRRAEAASASGAGGGRRPMGSGSDGDELRERLVCERWWAVAKAAGTGGSGGVVPEPNKGASVGRTLS